MEDIKHKSSIGLFLFLGFLALLAIVLVMSTLKVQQEQAFRIQSQASAPTLQTDNRDLLEQLAQQGYSVEQDCPDCCEIDNPHFGESGYKYKECCCPEPEAQLDGDGWWPAYAYGEFVETVYFNCKGSSMMARISPVTEEELRNKEALYKRMDEECAALSQQCLGGALKKEAPQLE